MVKHGKRAMVKGGIAKTLLAGAGAYFVTVAALAGFGKVGAAVREVPSSMCHASTDDYGRLVANRLQDVKPLESGR